MSDLALKDDETLDAMGGGRVRLVQARDGYRFNIDSVLLAAFTLDGLDVARAVRVVDLGTGCGVVALLVQSWRPGWRISGVERQEALADRARRNAAANGGTVEIVQADWSAIERPANDTRADVVVCNPPYFEADEGHLPEDPESAAARVALHGGVGEALRAARRIGTDRVSVRVVFPASRLARLFESFSQAKLAPARLRLVHARAGDDAYAVLAEARGSYAGPLRIEPPLVVHGMQERYSPEVERVLSAQGPDSAARG